MSLLEIPCVCHFSNLFFFILETNMQDRDAESNFPNVINSHTKTAS